MNPWTPTLRNHILGCIRSVPGSTNIGIARRLSEMRMTWPCVGKPLDGHVAGDGWTDMICNGRQDSGVREWRVEEIYPHLTRMRQRGEIHSVYDHVYVLNNAGDLVPVRNDRSQHWYYGPKIPDLADLVAVEAWLDDRYESVDDEGLFEPALDVLPL